MAEGDGLGRLQMGEAGHDGTGEGEGLFRQRALQGGSLAIKQIKRVADPEAHIGCDLIIARTGGVEAAGGGTDGLGEARFDIHVNIFERAGEGELAGFDLGGDIFKALRDCCSVFGLNNALFGEHGNMGARTGNVLTPQGLVEFDRGVDIFHDGIGARIKSPAPHLVAHRRAFPLAGSLTDAPDRPRCYSPPKDLLQPYDVTFLPRWRCDCRRTFPIREKRAVRQWSGG